MDRTLLFILIAFGLPVQAGWTRITVNGGEGEWLTDIPTRQKLSHFTHDEVQRLVPCTPAPGQAAGRADIRLIDSVSGYSIYNVTYYGPCFGLPEELPIGHAVIVKTGPDQYVEVFSGDVVGNGGATLIRTSGGQCLIWMRIDYGGNQHPMEDWGLLLGKNGTTVVDMRVVWRIAQAKVRAESLPENSLIVIWNATIVASRSAFVFEVPVNNWSDDSSPIIEIRFRVVQGRIAVGRSRVYQSAKRY